jgi:hypothetical protein
VTVCPVRRETGFREEVCLIRRWAVRTWSAMVIVCLFVCIVLAVIRSVQTDTLSWFLLWKPPGGTKYCRRSFRGTCEIKI